jgi:hypothetical protein
MIYLSIGLAALCLILIVALILKSSNDSSTSSAGRLLSLKDIRNVLSDLIDLTNLDYLAKEHEGMQSTSLLLQKTLHIMAAGLQEEGATALSQVGISFVERKAKEIASTLDEIGNPRESPPNVKEELRKAIIPWNTDSESPVFRDDILVGFLRRSAPSSHYLLGGDHPAGFYLSRGNWTTTLADDQLALATDFRSTDQPHF